MAMSAERTRPWFPLRVPVRPLLLGVALVVAAGGAYVAIAGNPLNRSQQAPTYQTATLSQGSLRLTVSATGPISNPQSVPLSFKSSGKLTEIDVGVGQAVTAGQVVARQDTTDLELSVSQAQANVNAQVANQAKVAAAATPQQLAAAQAQVNAAQTSVNNAQKTLDSTRASASAGIAGGQADVATAQVAFVSAQKALADTQRQVTATLQADQASLDNARQVYSDQLQTFHRNWDQVQAQLDQDQVTAQNAQAAIDNAQASLAAAQATADRSTQAQAVSVQNAQQQSTLAQNQQSLVSAQNQITSAQSTLNTAQAALVSDQAKNQQALESARASVNQVSEADIGRIKTGQLVNFTVTAFPAHTFSGTVASIQPGGTTTSNVVTYNVLCNVDPTDVQLLPSMTATVTITTEQDDNVLLVPNSAISYAQSQSRSSGAAVYVLRKGKPVRVAIQTASSDGQNMMVLSGVQPGDQVVTGLSTSNTQRSTSGTGSIFGFGPAGGGARPTSTPASRTGQVSQSSQGAADQRPLLDAPPPGGP